MTAEIITKPDDQEVSNLTLLYIVFAVASLVFGWQFRIIGSIISFVGIIIILSAIDFNFKTSKARAVNLESRITKLEQKGSLESQPQNSVK